MKFFEEPIVKIEYFDKENVLTASVVEPTPVPTVKPDNSGEVSGDYFEAQ